MSTENNRSSETVPAEPAAPDLEPLLQRPLHGTETPNPFQHGVAVGRILQVQDDAVMLTISCLGSETYRARTLCSLSKDCEGRECAVLFENGDRSRPLIMGLMVTKPENNQESTERTVRLNGETLILQADTELELRCGDSVILMQRDGRIEIRGTYITSQATATQRLRGGSIHMN